jgi:hypothetical protein
MRGVVFSLKTDFGYTRSTIYSAILLKSIMRSHPYFKRCGVDFGVTGHPQIALKVERRRQAADVASLGLRILNYRNYVEF